MKLMRCNNGHFYDGEKSANCPYCQSSVIRNDVPMPQADNDVHIIVYKRVCYNICKWLTQTVALSILPLFFYILIHWIFQIQTDVVNGYIKEICAFTMVISSSVTIELSKKKYQTLHIKEVVSAAQLFLMTVFLLLYGIIIGCIELEVPLTEDVANNMFRIVVTISITYLIIALLLQIVGGIYDD